MNDGFLIRKILRRLQDSSPSVVLDTNLYIPFFEILEESSTLHDHS